MSKMESRKRHARIVFAGAKHADGREALERDGQSLGVTDGHLSVNCPLSNRVLRENRLPIRPSLRPKDAIDPLPKRILITVWDIRQV